MRALTAAASLTDTLPGLRAPGSWPLTLLAASGWLALMIAWSPIADRVARRWAPAAPDPRASRTVRRSRPDLVAGVVVAWVFGGLLEELALRGVVVEQVWESLSGPGHGVAGAATGTLAAAAGILAASAVAGLGHLYQGRRGALVVVQVSVLFGVLYAISGRNLYAVVLCHGLYDTVALRRVAVAASRAARRRRPPP